MRWLALLDSGADSSCLPVGIAVDLGVKFDRSIVKQGGGVGGTHNFWQADDDVDLNSDAGTIRLLRPSINEHLPLVLLGRADIFNEFRISFEQRGQTFTMTPYKKTK